MVRKLFAKKDAAAATTKTNQESNQLLMKYENRKTDGRNHFCLPLEYY
jgi:hypothetical protein